jgi:hypothetical protein
MMWTSHFGALATVAGVLVAVGMLMLIMVSLVEPAGAAFPGQNGKIAFTSARDGNSEIYTMNPNGQGVDQLTNNNASDELPAWSAGGNKIVFDSKRDGDYEIYAMNANGTGVDRLTNNPKADLDPDWQPLKPPPGPDPTPGPGPTPPPKGKAAKVMSTFPKANAKGVSPAANITATFSKKMKASSINATTFKLFKKGSKTKLGAAVSYSAATRKAKLNPTKSLQKGATYRAVVTTGAKDLAGKSLDQNGSKSGSQPKVWLFTVRK